MQIKIRVIPNASRTQVVGWLEDSLKIKVQAPPEGGRANVAIIKCLSKVLDVPARTIEILKGETSPNKLVCIQNFSLEELLKRFPKD